MTKRQRAAMVAAVLAILTALGGAGTSLSKSVDQEPRIRVLESQRDDDRGRLERIERKIDWLIERVK